MPDMVVVGVGYKSKAKYFVLEKPHLPEVPIENNP